MRIHELTESAAMFDAVLVHETTPENARLIQQQGFKMSRTGVFFNMQGTNYSGGGYGNTQIKARISGSNKGLLDLSDDDNLPDDLDEFADGEEIADYARDEGYWGWTDGMQLAVLEKGHIEIQDDLEPINEIERLHDFEYEGGKGSLSAGSNKKTYEKLPGGSGLLYSIERENSEYIIKLWSPFDPNKPPQIIGELTLYSNNGAYGIAPSIPYALQVNTITVDEDYRGMGLAKAMYGIVLTIMKRPLLAGRQQTLGGRRSWVSLSQIPGVEVKGYIGIQLSDLNPQDQLYTPDKKKVERRIDTIMGELGGQYLGTTRHGYHFFAFDVLPNSDGTELEAYVKQNLAKVYDNDVNFATGLYAVWEGS